MTEYSEEKFTPEPVPFDPAFAYEGMRVLYKETIKCRFVKNCPDNRSTIKYGVNFSQQVDVDNENLTIDTSVEEIPEEPEEKVVRHKTAKVGEIVLIADDSKYYRQGLREGIKMTGRIIDIADNDHPIIVAWDDGTENCYQAGPREFDLIYPQ